MKQTMQNQNKPQQEHVEKERTNVNITIDRDELESIKAATRNDKNASAILSAARIGRDLLCKSLVSA